jgi:hypothetical protein
MFVCFFSYLFLNLFAFLFYAMQTILVNYSVLYPHHLDADPDSTYHSDADPDADTDVDPDSDFSLMQMQIWIRI